MTTSMTVSALVLQASAPDTVVMVPVRDAFDYLQGATLILLLVGVGLVVLLFFRIHAVMTHLRSSVDPLVDRADKGLEPVLEHARSISENVDYVSHAIRTDVEGLTRAIERIRARLDQASDHMEDRVEEFNALLEVVQDEAEEIFLDTAATVRGVRQGSRSLGRRKEFDENGGREDSDGPEPERSRSSGGAVNDGDLGPPGIPESETGSG